MKIRRHFKKYALLFIPVVLFIYLLTSLFGTATNILWDDSHNRFENEIAKDLERQGSITENAVDDINSDAMDTYGFRKVNIQNLVHNEIPNTLHYVWCGNKTFKFNNFLSVMSAWKILRPDIIEFHTQYPVRDDPKNYHSWFAEIQRSIPSFSVRTVPGFTSSWDQCSISYGIEVLKDRGGIYVDNTFMFLTHFLNSASTEMSIAASSVGSNKIGLIRAKRNGPKLNDILNAQKMKTLDSEFPEAIGCEILENNMNVTDDISCVLLKRDIFPVDIFNLKNNFGKVSRQVIFGYGHGVREESRTDSQIPKIVHYVWFGEHELSFIMYLSLISTFNIVKPQKVFIHGDHHLYGTYWDKVKNNPLLVNIYRERPRSVYGHDVIYTQHYSDILRADILLKYGGIYMDFDALWLKSIDDLIEAGHDVILNFDHMKHGDYPETINMGVIMAKPHAKFLQIWQDKFINYKTHDFFHNAIQLPYKVYEMHPDLVHVERHLQVMCYQLKCHPTFKDNYMDWTKEQVFDWKSEAYAIHFTFPDPKAFSSFEALQNGTDKFAEMGKYILRMSGIHF